MSELHPTPVCENCAYSDCSYSPANTADGEWLLCRRRSPLVVAAVNDGYDGGNATFPRVAPDEWCGEWVQNAVYADGLRRRTYLQADMENARDYLQDKKAWEATHRPSASHTRKY